MDRSDAVFQKVRELSGQIDPEELGISCDDAHYESRIENERRRHEDFRKAKEAIETLGNIINGRDGLVRTAIVHEMLRTHRFLQGKLIEEILYALGDMGKMYSEDPTRWADARNEFHMNLCVKLREKFENELFWSEEK